MKKTIRLLGPALIGGQMRYPAEGGISVDEDTADSLIADDLAEEVERVKPAKGKASAD